MVNSEDFLENSVTSIGEDILDNLLISSLDTTTTREVEILNCCTGVAVTENFIENLPEEVLHKVDLAKQSQHNKNFL